jgi:hypothetical protein
MGAQHKEIFVKIGEGTVGNMDCGCGADQDHITIQD